MKKNWRLLIPTLVLTAGMLYSCSKEDTKPLTKTQLLSLANWKFKSAAANGTDVSSLLAACQKDNLMTFAAAGTGTVNEGPSKCNAGDPDNTTFSWTFANNETQINVSAPLFANGTNTLTILTLTETDLVVTMGYSPPVGASVLMTLSFIH